MKIEIIDDFLSSYHADMYEKTFNGMNRGSGLFQWYFSNSLNGKSYLGNYQFTNCCYDVAGGVNNPKETPFYEPLLNKLGITMSNVKKIKSNLYPWTGRRIHHQTHIDYEPNGGLMTCLYYVNDSNRVTIFDGKKKIRCKGNRSIIFDGSIPHHSTTPTNVNYGCSINIDYLL